MELFEGKSKGRFDFDWAQINTNGASSMRPSINTWTDALRRKGYDLVLDRFGLINCGKFGGDSTSFNNKFAVSLPTNFTNQNTSVYVAFKNMNSVLTLIGDSKSKTFVTFGRGLPVGRVVTIVTMSYIKEKFYFAKQDVTILNANGSTPQAIRLAPVVAEKEEIKEMLNNL
jgi:hypothetical protein